MGAPGQHKLFRENLHFLRGPGVHCFGDWMRLRAILAPQWLGFFLGWLLVKQRTLLTGDKNPGVPLFSSSVLFHRTTTENLHFLRGPGVHCFGDWMRLRAVLARQWLAFCPRHCSWGQPGHRSLVPGGKIQENPGSAVFGVLPDP